MLRELAVHNLAVIEDVRVDLEPGFCAWTGETGAGKTLLLEALGLLLGERGSADLLRAGADELRIVGRFELDRPGLRQAVEQVVGSLLADAELIVTRRLTRAGRSYAYLNEQPVAVSTLRRLGALLVDIHGQHESQSLLRPEYQLQLLDAFGDLEERRQQYQTLVERVRELRGSLSTLVAERQQRQRELSLLRFEREKLDQAALQPGELAELSKARERLVHAQALQEFAATGCARLYDEEGSCVEQIGKLQREAAGWAAVDPVLEELTHRLATLCADAQDLAETLRDLTQRWEADPARRDEVEQRLRDLRRLETKYNRPIEGLIVYRATLDEQEKHLQDQEDNEAVLQGELETTFAKLRDAGSELTRQRQRVAKRFGQAVHRELSDLGMGEARLEAVLQPLSLGNNRLTAEVPTSGFEQLELMLAANRGEPSRPLRKVASGGELSRTMLGRVNQ
jgi:DNA repair protein RecN (Recombination protein N)